MAKSIGCVTVEAWRCQDMRPGDRDTLCLVNRRGATLAFEALRDEVALVRRAVAGLSAERTLIEIPDYSETLGQIMRASAATAQSLRALAEMPALRLSAKD